MPRRRAPDDPGRPDVRSPARYLWWLVLCQRGRVALGALWGTAWMLGLVLPPYLISRAVDDGLRAGDRIALVAWTLAVLAAGVVNAVLGILRHRTMTRIRLDARDRTVRVLTRHAVALGAVLPRQVGAGEMVAIGASDIGRIAQALTVTGPGVGAVFAYAVVAVLLVPMSALLAAVVLLGVPLLAVLVGPLLGRVHHAEAGYRERQGALTARAGDIAAGLRVLRGIGGAGAFGHRYRDGSRALQAEGYRIATVTSWVDALAVGLPALYLAAVVWLSARLAAAEEITVGDLVAVYGYVAVLVVPVSFFIEGADDLPRGLVAAERVVRILRVRPPARAADAVPGPPAPADLSDAASGLVVRAGELTAVASGDPAGGAAP
ncbi:ABC transporter transmembrane domain-containing protein, partial [Pseudonocardia nigra]|uniref:ABC transporter transmembrane domain-containing protein n=1 Tax=Pseudonocardia nigra TaxID=1921578 RepID=UPI001C5E52D4